MPQDDPFRAPDTYEYRPGPSVFMSGESDWIIRRVGKPGIIASLVGHEQHAKAAVDALNQAAKHDIRVAAAIRAQADRMAAALRIALWDAHPTYGSTAGWRGGAGGQTITQGCSFIDPPPKDAWMHVYALNGPLTDYVQSWGPDLPRLVESLRTELREQGDGLKPARTTDPVPSLFDVLYRVQQMLTDYEFDNEHTADAHTIAKLQEILGVSRGKQ